MYITAHYAKLASGTVASVYRVGVLSPLYVTPFQGALVERQIIHITFVSKITKVIYKK